jgi:hypothetical protein
MVFAALGVIGLGIFEANLAAGQEPRAATPASHTESQWRGVHLMSPGRDGLQLLKRAIAEKLAPMGVNVVILEVNYNFDFRSHPELSGGGDGALRAADARDLAETCRNNHVRLIPMLNCLGHQSWARNTLPLLTKHPELDESPEVPKDNPGIYCRSWCPLHPDVNKIVFQAARGAREKTRPSCSRRRSTTCTIISSTSASARC